MGTDSGIRLSIEDRGRLDGWVAGRNTPQKLVWRARIVLMWAEGAGVTAIVRATGKTKRTAYRWRDRYIKRGIAGLERDASRPGRKPPLSAAIMVRVMHMTLHEKPPAGTHWSVRKLAKAVGLSPSSVQRIWAAHGLKPSPMTSGLSRRCKTSSTWAGSSQHRAELWPSCRFAAAPSRSMRSILCGCSAAGCGCSPLDSGSASTDASQVE